MSEGLSRRRGHGSASAASSSLSGGAPSSNNHNDGEEGLDGRRLSPKVRSASNMGASGMGDAARRGSSHASGSGSGSGGPSSDGAAQATGSAGDRKPGHKIAFDPQDLETRDEELEQPLLTLMEEIILLGIKECVDSFPVLGLSQEKRQPGTARWPLCSAAWSWTDCPSLLLHCCALHLPRRLPSTVAANR